MTSRKKSPEALLEEALAAGDNLEVLKALRYTTFMDYKQAGTEGEFADRVRLAGNMLQLSKAITALEGSKERFPTAVEEAFKEAAALRGLGFGDDEA